MRKAVYSISIGGQNVSSAFDPLLLSLEIELTEGGETDRLTIELDDSNGQIQLPSPGASVSAALGWSDSGSVVAFEGFTDEPKSSGTTPKGADQDDGSIEQLISHGDRGSGRTLTITAHSADLTGKVKQPMQAHADNMTFGDVAKQWGEKAGLSSIQVDSALQSVKRAYWSIANENFMTWGARTARDLSATFKIIGSTGVFVPRAGGVSASGQALTGISATWGVNLLSWSIAPVLSRPNFGTFSTRNWDPLKATWNLATMGGGSGPTHIEQFKAPDADQAQARSGSNAAESKRDRGGADTVTIDGEPDAQPSAPCTVAGIRAGVDGAYTINRVKHHLARSGGFTTTLAFNQPEDGAGTDSR